MCKELIGVNDDRYTSPDGQVHMHGKCVMRLVTVNNTMREEFYDDVRRLNFLQDLTDEARYSGMVVLRMSEEGRGWRLHETRSYPDATDDVREAIDNFMEQRSG